MVLVTQHVTCIDDVQAFVAAWRSYAARTYDPQTSMPTSGPFEVRTTDDWQTATAYVWVEPH